MLIQTHDGKQFDIPEENLEGFLKAYNYATGFDPRKLSPDPEVNPERGVNFGGGVRAAAQGLPVVGSYADEAEATVRAAGDALVQEMMYQQEHRNDPKPEPKLPGLTGKLMQGMEDYNAKQDRYNEFFDQSYDKYLKNARESYEGAKRNMPGVAYPLEIGTGIAGEAGLAALTGGASLHPAVQGAMGAVYGYGMGEGDALNRTATAGVIGITSGLLPVAGKYGVKYGVKKPLEYFGKKIANKEMPALTKALQKDTVLGKAILNTDKQPTIEKVVAQLNTLQKTAQTEEQKTVVDNIIRSVRNGEAPNKILRDSGLWLKRSDPFAREVSTTLLEASTSIPQLNIVRTAINKAESFGEKTAVVNDLLKNTTKKESLYNAVSSDVRDVLNKTWDDQLREGILETARNHDLVGTDMKDLMESLLAATSKGVDTTIKDTADDLVTASIRNNIKKALANETKLPAGFINELEDRITSEVLARRTANTLVGKGLESSASGLGLSLIKDATLGIAADAIIPGSSAGIVGALARNFIPGGGSTISKLAGKASNFAVEKALNKTIKEGGEPALIKTLTKNNPNMKNYANKTVKEIAKAGEKTAEYKAIKEILKDKPVEKIVNALKPYKAVKEGYNEASKKPAKQLVKEALQVAPKTAIPVGIRETTREMYNEDAIPFAAKPKREEPLKQSIVEPKEVTQTVQQPVEIPKATMNPNNLSYNTIVLPGSEGDTSSSMEKFIRMIQALYPQYYQKVA